MNRFSQKIFKTRFSGRGFYKSRWHAARHPAVFFAERPSTSWRTPIALSNFIIPGFGLSKDNAA
jgi:hypothetical protein